MKRRLLYSYRAGCPPKQNLALVAAALAEPDWQRRMDELLGTVGETATQWRLYRATTPGCAERFEDAPEASKEAFSRILAIGR